MPRKERRSMLIFMSLSSKLRINLSLSLGLGLACRVVCCCFKTKSQCHRPALPGTTTSLQITTIFGIGN